MNVESYELACSITGDDINNLPDVSALPEQLGKVVTALVKLSRLQKATNGEWVADFNNRNQDKWTGWLKWSPSLGAFVLAVADCAYSNAYLGARFWFPNPDAARYFTEQHIELINDLHNSNL